MVLINYWKSKFMTYDIEKFNSFEILHVNIFDINKNIDDDGINECILAMERYLKEIESKKKTFRASGAKVSCVAIA